MAKSEIKEELNNAKLHIACARIDRTTLIEAEKAKVKIDNENILLACIIHHQYTLDSKKS